MCYTTIQKELNGQADRTKEDLMMENMTETMKSWGKKVKEFVSENKDLILMIAGTIAVMAAVCALVGILNRKK